MVSLLGYGEFLKYTLNSSKILILTHHNADLDSIIPALILKRVLTRLGKDVHCIAPLDVSKMAKKLLTLTGMLNEVKIFKDEEDFLSNVKIDTYNMIILVDVSTLVQVGLKTAEILRRIHDKVIIAMLDHHEPNVDTLRYVKVPIIECFLRSTALILYKVLKMFHMKLNRLEAKLLSLAAISESRDIFSYDSNALQYISELMEESEGVKVRYTYLKGKEDYSELVARLKALKRMRVYKLEVNGKVYLVAFSNIGAYEASVARSLIELGVDMAFIIGGKKDVRVCARASRRIISDLNLHLGRDIMIALGKFIGGEGGGHDMAASANGIRNRGNVEAFVLNRIRRIIKPSKITRLI